MGLGNLEDNVLYYMTFTGLESSVLAELLGYEGPLLDNVNNYLCFEWEPYEGWNNEGWDISFMHGPLSEEEPGESQRYFQNVDNGRPINSYEELVQLVRGEDEISI